MHQRNLFVKAVARSILIGLMSTFVVISATTAVAEACSIAPPEARVEPTSNLRPGDPLWIKGANFVDIHYVSVARTDAEPALTQQIPPNSCDGIVIEPRLGITISWYGANHKEVLAVVDGPDFSIQAAVPKNATRGAAVVDVGGVTIDVTVGDSNPPCDWLSSDPTSAAIRDCPEPWPCEVYLAQGLARPECPPPCEYGVPA